MSGIRKYHNKYRTVDLDGTQIYHDSYEKAEKYLEDRDLSKPNQYRWQTKYNKRVTAKDSSLPVGICETTLKKRGENGSLYTYPAFVLVTCIGGKRKKIVRQFSDGVFLHPNGTASVTREQALASIIKAANKYADEILGKEDDVS